jgi:hypothetical protein
MSRRKFKLARDPFTGQLQWAPATTGGSFAALVGWFFLAGSTVLFLLVCAYFGYVMFLARPSFDPSSTPESGAYMREGLQRLNARPDR